MRQNQNACSILRYWRSLELFSPPPINAKEGENDPNKPIYRAEEGKPLPWEAAHQFQKRTAPTTYKNPTRRFSVFFGVYEIANIRAVLEEKFGKDDDSGDDRTGGKSCLFTFGVDNDGLPIFDSFLLSSCAWAIAKTQNSSAKDLGFLEGFEAEAQTYKRLVEEIYSKRDDSEIVKDGVQVARALSFDDLTAILNGVVEALGLKNPLETAEIRIEARFVSANKESNDESPLLNSFFLNDLDMVASALKNGEEIGAGLSAYLDENIDRNERIDVRDKSSNHALFKRFSPSLIPTGHWLGKGAYPLVYSQQIAVNSVMSELGEKSGLFAVNGPPGTGKTTLLRDLIAAIVVERAKRLAALSSPSAAFGKRTEFKKESFTYHIYEWAKELTGFGIVVASSNNGAVANVTLEIPSIEAVDRGALGDLDYFAEIASRLNEPSKEAWALVAARLGQKKYRRDFVDRFWRGAFGKNKNATLGMNDRLRELKQKDNPAKPIDYEEARKRFLSAIAAENVIRAERESAYKAIIVADNLNAELKANRETLQDKRDKKAALDLDLSNLQGKINEITYEQNEAEKERRKHKEFKPGVLDFIATLGRANREWAQKDRELGKRYDDAYRAIKEILVKRKESLDNLMTLDRDLINTQARQERLERELSEAENCLAAIESAGAKWFARRESALDYNEREKSSPWIDARWDSARSKTFIEALNLHRAFIENDPSKIWCNLNAAMDVLSNDMPRNIETKEVETAWNTLFFVVPVVSTTFSSLDRMFWNMGKESIGWLLIDEAGQATPQAAVGAIYRAKRSVVVGDPLQLEPIVNVPFSVQSIFAKQYGVNDQVWSPSRCSVQRLADRTSVFGTTINDVWVASPLRVHRRCAEPMFSISNAISYDNMMVFGTISRGKSDLPPSRWIDVQSDVSNGNWIQKEGEALEGLLKDLQVRGVNLKEVFIISPFKKDVQWRLQQIASAFKIERDRVGTVHTTQGKEADIVIIVLGGKPQGGGARDWVASSANLLNVAASRAKERLYVIGDRADWSKRKYFDECSNLLRSAT